MQAGLVGVNKTFDEENLLTNLRGNAKTNCKHCHGKGFTGYIDEIIPKGHKKGEEKISTKIKFYYACYKCFEVKEEEGKIELIKKVKE